MTSIPATTHAILWHVRAGDADRCGPVASRMQAALRALGGSVASPRNVYRTLARLCAKDASPPRALLVCVDDLGLAEMEFFSLVARRLGEAPVYAYGEERARHRVERAVALGAIEANEAAILALADDDARHAPSIHHLSVPPPRPRDHAAPRERTSLATRSDENAPMDGSSCAPAESLMNPCGSTAPSASRRDSVSAAVTVAARAGLTDDTPPRESDPVSATAGHDESASPSLRLAAASDEVEYATPDGNDVSDVELPPRVDEDDSDRPARVPWLRYDDRPIRLPPRRTSLLTEDGPASIGPPTNGSPVARPGDRSAAAPTTKPPQSLSDLRFEPLLTEEELRALLGDELDELDPRATPRDAGSASP